MGELSLDGFTQLGLRVEAPRHPGRPRAVSLRVGERVPYSDSNTVPFDIPRGSFAHISGVACAHCPSVLGVRELPKRELGAYARRQGWDFVAASSGWVCPRCIVELSA